MKNFTPISNSLIRDKRLSDGEFRLFCELMSYRYGKDTVYPSHAKMASNLDVNVRTIGNNIKKLKELDLISWKKRGYSKSNEYSFNDENIFLNESSNNENKNISMMKEMSDHIGNNLQSNNNKKNNKESNNKGIESLREIVNSWKTKQ